MASAELMVLPEKEIGMTRPSESCPWKGEIQDYVDSFETAKIGDIIVDATQEIIEGAKYCTHSQNCKRQRCLESNSDPVFKITLDSEEIINHNNSL